MDRTKESGKTKGGGVCILVNKCWCMDVQTISTGCSPDLEHLMIKCRPFYLPWEFTAVIVTTVYIPSHASAAQVQLGCSTNCSVLLTNMKLDTLTFSIVAGDFNKVQLEDNAAEKPPAYEVSNSR